MIFLFIGIFLSAQKLPLYRYFGLGFFIITLLYFSLTNILIKKTDRIDYGYKGEIDVSKVLDNLPFEYKIIHDIVVDNKYNIDHLVIGPTGIYTIETKNHRGIVSNKGDILYINNKLFEKDIVKQAISEALYIKNKIENELKINIFVKPVIVFANRKTYIKSDEVNGVKTLSIRMLQNYLLKQPRKLSFENIERIYNLFKNNN